MTTTHCFSCGAPTNGDLKMESFCDYCKDEKGNLKSRIEIKKGIAGWLSAWTDETLTEEQLLQRAEFYMKSMPKWAS